MSIVVSYPRNFSYLFFQELTDCAIQQPSTLFEETGRILENPQETFPKFWKPCTGFLFVNLVKLSRCLDALGLTQNWAQFMS